LDTVIDLAKKDRLLENALFDCVSAQKSFKKIFSETRNTKLILKILKTLFLLFIKKMLKLRVPASGHSGKG